MIIGVIPARGGSKRLPRKNIKLLNRKPLIAYTIEQALDSKYLDKVVVTTDDKDIAEISKKYQAEVIIRPKNLARDDTPTIDVIYHLINFLKLKDDDIIVLLQPTSPLRTTEDIDNAIRLFLNSNCESVVSVCETEFPPYWTFVIENNVLKPLIGWDYLKKDRNHLKKTYKPNGAIYIARCRTLKEYKSFYTERTIPYIMPVERSVDIDTYIDFMLAEILIKIIKNK